MGEKYYKPIIKDGSHLAQSKKNEGRVRGISFDADNKNPDIVEWEEVVPSENFAIDNHPLDFTTCTYNERTDFGFPNTSNEAETPPRQLTEEEEEFCQVAGTILGNAAWEFFERWGSEKIKPWLDNKVKPSWDNGFDKIKRKMKHWKDRSTKKNGESDTEEQAQNVAVEMINKKQPLPEVAEQFDSEFDKHFKADISPEEARQHAINLINAMLVIASEIRFFENVKINSENYPEEMRIEQQKADEKILVQHVANRIDGILSDKSQYLDVNTSKQIFDLLGGGININGEYIPVETAKIDEAIKNYRGV